jgi:hypothetical protein
MLALVLGACGNKEAHPHYADTEGVYVDAGPITYQVQLSRELNPYNVEDVQYLRGLPAGTTRPKPDEEWFAVFLWASNQSGKTAATADPTAFDIIDTQGNIYQPILLDPIANPFAWTSQVLRPGETQPSPESVANYGPTQGGELLFKINTSAYSNRPLLLRIHGPSNQIWASVSLDL